MPTAAELCQNGSGVTQCDRCSESQRGACGIIVEEVRDPNKIEDIEVATAWAEFHPSNPEDEIPLVSRAECCLAEAVGADPGVVPPEMQEKLEND